ncbi:MAG: hypothetical protein ACFE9D_12115 [Promethearchaeota archaeon]
MSKLSLAKGLGVVLFFFVIFLAFIPTVQAKPFRSEMEVYFNPLFGTDPSEPIWIGYIHGDLEGTMTFWATGPDPPKDIGYDADNALGYEWNVHFFTEDWVIETSLGTIHGIDKGCTVSANWKFRMNGEVTYATGAYSHLVGHQVHMNGQINWGLMQAIGPVNIN